MIDEIVDRAKPGVGDAGCVEPLDHFSCAQTTEHTNDRFIESRPVRYAIAVRTETIIFRQLRTPEDVTAETDPLSPILNGQINWTSLSSVVRSVRSD